MERLTNKKEADAQRKQYEIRLASGYPRNIPEERFLKLAAYEDTGLEPEDFDALQKREQGLAELLVQVSCGCAVSYARLAELAQAEKDGRLVALPIPVGAGKAAYGLTDSDDGQQHIVTIECDYLEKLEIWDNPGHEVVIEADGWEIGKSDIGKTVFLTREEAEAALKKRGGAAK